MTETGADNGAAGASYTFGDPDFRFQEFRSNIVARWEYKPGSSLFVVWAQGRTGEAQGWEGFVPPQLDGSRGRPGRTTS